MFNRLLMAHLICHQLQSDVNKFVKNKSTQFQIWIRKPGYALTQHVNAGNIPQKSIKILLLPEPVVDIKIRNADGSDCQQCNGHTFECPYE